MRCVATLRPRNLTSQDIDITSEDAFYWCPSPTSLVRLGKPLEALFLLLDLRLCGSTTQKEGVFLVNCIA